MIWNGKTFALSMICICHSYLFFFLFSIQASNICKFFRISRDYTSVRHLVSIGINNMKEET